MLAAATLVIIGDDVSRRGWTFVSAQATATRTAAQRIAEYVHGLYYEDLPSEVVAKTKDIIAFNVGQGLRGHAKPEGQQAVRLARMLSAGTGPATIIGTDLRAQPLDAAFANSSLMRALQMDDVLFPVGVHASMVTLPAAFALGETHQRSGRDVITAIVTAYEVIGKIGSWTWSDDKPRRPTIPYGPFGSTVAAARLLRLDPERLTHALGYAAHHAMGLARDPWTHYYSLVARNGMMSAYLAEAGGETAADILEHPLGFFQTFLDGVPEDLDAIVDRLGTNFEILNATTKRYPGTGLNILSTEFMRDLVAEHHVTARDVAAIELHFPTARENLDFSYSKGPFTDGGAASSALFQLAIVLLDGGRTDFARYERWDDPEISEILQKIEVAFEDGHPSPRYTRLVVRTRDGRRLEREGDQLTFPPIDAEPWLRDAGAELLGVEKTKLAARLINELDSVGDISELMRALARD